jgi:hypothetical protein
MTNFKQWIPTFLLWLQKFWKSPHVPYPRLFLFFSLNEIKNAYLVFMIEITFWIWGGGGGGGDPIFLDSPFCIFLLEINFIVWKILVKSMLD